MVTLASNLDDAMHAQTHLLHLGDLLRNTLTRSVVERQTHPVLKGKTQEMRWPMTACSSLPIWLHAGPHAKGKGS